MAQAHGDRLTAVDASFLAQEGESSHMHVGAVLIFEGPPPAYEDFCNQIRSRLHLVPRYRQKLAFPQPETSGAQLAARGLKGLVKAPLGLTARALSAATRPAHSLEVAREALEG